MGAVPLLTREGEVNLARKMERGKLRMQKADQPIRFGPDAVMDISDQIEAGDEWISTMSWIWAMWKRVSR